MQTHFVYTAFPQRIVFGVGSLAKVTEELEGFGASRAMILCTPEQRELAEMVAGSIGTRAVGIYDKAVMHVPMGIVADACEQATSMGADSVVAIGGGSTTGLGKAIALTSILPILAIPTTYAGSEVTPIYGITYSGEKRTGRNPRVLPRTVIYDPLLSVSLSPKSSAASGMNAIAHCVEAIYAKDGNPITAMVAEEAIRALAGSLPEIVKDPHCISARCAALYGAWLAGTALASVSMGLHHKLCHVLGATFDLPHAETHSIILPYVARYNSDAAPEAMGRIARAIGSTDAPRGLFDLATSLGLQTKLSDIGMPRDGLARAARMASDTPYPNPEAVKRDRVLALLNSAYDGAIP